MRAEKISERNLIKFATRNKESQGTSLNQMTKEEVRVMRAVLVRTSEMPAAHLACSPSPPLEKKYLQN